MGFHCPGGCAQTHPVEAGNLVWQQGDGPVVILCGPCTAQLVLARSGGVRLP